MIRSFDPVDEVQVAVVVGGRHVAGLQPAVVGEHRRGRLGVVEVAGEHVVALHPHLADVADEARRRCCRRAAPRRRSGPARPSRTATGAPVEVVTIGEASVSPYPSRISTPNRSSIVSATVTAAAGRRRTTRGGRVGERVGGQPSKWANAAHNAGAPGMTVMPRSWIDCSGGRRVEPLHQHDGRADRAGPDRARRSGRRCGTTATRRRSRRRRSCARWRSGPARCCDDRLPWREHRRPWGAGGSAGEDQHREMVGVHVDPLDGLRLEQPVERHEVTAGGIRSPPGATQPDRS